MGARLLGVDEYHRELVVRLRGLLGDELIGVYAGGSFALGGFDHALSDLDIAAVGVTHVGETTKRAIVEVLRHESLPCPARGLEFVLYAEPVVRMATTDPGFELNLSSGAGMSFRVDHEPAARPDFLRVEANVVGVGEHLLEREALGNFPQAFTHLSLISVAVNLDRLLDQTRS